MAWSAGQKLQGGKYTIEQELGEGGFGITYRATDTNGCYFVIKTLNDKVQKHPDFAKFQQDFLNEALRLAKCTHPHIVRVNEVIQEGQLWCMVMEYIDGEDLASRVVNQGVLPEAEALRYIQQIGEALIVVHNNGFLHRDIKPQNIMLRSGKSEAVLIDFGIAREFTPNLTQTHTQMLSDGFAPIEQYDKRAKRGACTDIYALAATLYSVLTGEVPTSAPLRAIGTELEPPKDVNPTINDRVNQAILKGMEIKPEARPQSVQEWLELLETKISPIIRPIPKSVSPKPIESSQRYQSSQQLSSKKLSAVGVNYTKLKDLLSARKWREADLETNRKMLEVMDRKKEGLLRVVDIENFLCVDLHTIDTLWFEYSDGWFGFSIQKSIWESVNQDWVEFGNTVGWRESSEGEWKYYSELTFTRNVLKGHLPASLAAPSEILSRILVPMGYLFQRLEECQL